MTAQINTETAGGVRGVPGRPARPRRFDDDARNNAYWQRVQRIAAAAPPLESWQRAAIRTAFTTATKEAA